MAARRNVGPAVFSWAHHQPTYLVNYSQHNAKGIVIHILGVKMPTNMSATATRPHKTTKVVKLKPTVEKPWRHTCKNCAVLTRPTLLAPMRKHHHENSIPFVNPTQDNKHSRASHCAMSTPAQHLNGSAQRVSAPPGAREPQCPRHRTKTHRSSNNEQLLPCGFWRHVSLSDCFP